LTSCTDQLTVHDNLHTARAVSARRQQKSSLKNSHIIRTEEARRTPQGIPGDAAAIWHPPATSGVGPLFGFASHTAAVPQRRLSGRRYRVARCPRLQPWAASHPPPAACYKPQFAVLCTPLKVAAHAASASRRARAVEGSNIPPVSDGCLFPALSRAPIALPTRSSSSLHMQGSRWHRANPYVSEGPASEGADELLQSFSHGGQLF